MKSIFKLAIALLALFSFTACSDVPMPYEEPGTGGKGEPTTEAKGTGTATDPYNVAGALKVVNALAAGGRHQRLSMSREPLRRSRR